MPKPIRNLTNMEIDEISLVDKGANQHAMITIAKRATEEDEMPDLYYDDEGAVVDVNALEDGDIVYDPEGNAYQFEADDEVEDEVEDQEPAMVGKSAFFEKQTKDEQTGFAKRVMEELSKAFSDEDRDAVIAKALGRVEELERQQEQFERIAKSERDLRLTREYISKAAEYNLPIAPEELGPVLYRMAETMSYDDCAVIAKALETAGTILYEEIGYQGGGDNVDIMDQVSAQAREQFGKSEEFNLAKGVNAVFDDNPQAYDEYLAQRGY